MPRRRIVMLLVACALAAPAAARAADPAPDTGGTAMPAGDLALTATQHVLVGQVATFRGSLPADAGRVVTIERHDAVTDEWIAVATALIASDGTLRGDVGDRRRRPPAHARERPAPGRDRRRPGARRPARGLAHRLPAGDGELVRPRVLRPQDRVRRSA